MTIQDDWIIVLLYAVIYKSDFLLHNWAKIDN